MSEEKSKVFQLSDDVIALVRELVQLSLLTGTNIIDHFRAVQLEELEPGKLYPTEEYINSYNAMVTSLSEAIEKAQTAEQDASSDDKETN